MTEPESGIFEKGFYSFSCCLRAKWLQSTLCDPADCSLPSSSVHGVLQAGILKRVSMSSARGIFPIQGSNPGRLWLLHCSRILYRWATGEAHSFKCWANPFGNSFHLNLNGLPLMRSTCGGRWGGRENCFWETGAGPFTSSQILSVRGRWVSCRDDCVESAFSSSGRFSSLVKPSFLTGKEDDWGDEGWFPLPPRYLPIFWVFVWTVPTRQWAERGESGRA